MSEITYTKAELERKILNCKDLYRKHKQKAEEALEIAKLAKQEMENYETLLSNQT